ncbi:NAD kinase-like isoform X2 [Saccostrea echinata]|uniref:NAD kinase-like isoform X2 n=1 Tax=Saccostrea echinata TaxID=191078 RepID=UPI002A8359AE|nr:NAD kinase-like isoform X2 [Saccostrea echinata]
MSTPVNGIRRKSNSESESMDLVNDKMVTFNLGENFTDESDGGSQVNGVKRRNARFSRTRRTKSLYGVMPNCKFGPCGSILDDSATSLTIPDPGSQKLNWNKPPLTVLVIKKMHDENALSAFTQLVKWLIQEKSMVVYVEKAVFDDAMCTGSRMCRELQKQIQTFEEEKDDLTNKIDFVICLGGDGTLLYASSLFQASMPPVMAFNMGSLGFLTPFSFHNYKEQVTQVLEGNAGLLLRYRLKCVICRKDSHMAKIPHVKQIQRSHSTVQSKTHLLVFNEVVVDRGQSPYLSNIDLYVEGKLVTTVQGDGLIISTPTGSTAYAVAAGASMVHPNVPAIVITPICPHSLSFRPVVVPAGAEIKIMVSPEARNSAWVSLDGRNRQEIFQGDSVRITTAQYPVPSVCAKDQMDDWFESLAECLHWNVRKPQKAMPGLTESPSTTNINDSS